jgi:hypothetical protein
VEDGKNLRRGAVTLPNDVSYRRCLGPATPPGNGPDRYFLVVPWNAADQP